MPEEPTELLYAPRPSAMPILFAFGVALVIVGSWAWMWFAVAGAVLALVALVRMLSVAGDAISRLPRRQQPYTTGHRFR
jgi:hypothetical protein